MSNAYMFIGGPIDGKLMAIPGSEPPDLWHVISAGKSALVSQMETVDYRRNLLCYDAEGRRPVYVYVSPDAEPSLLARLVLNYRPLHSGLERK